MSISYTNDKSGLEGLIIKDFFQGWPKPPSVEILKESIMNASYISLAIDDEKTQLVGYITAVSDGVLAAYIPFLEVIPSYQKQGIGTKLVNCMLEQLSQLYMIDVVCDKEIAGFYEEAGFESWHAMIRRNYQNQSGPQSAN